MGRARAVPAEQLALLLPDAPDAQEVARLWAPMQAYLESQETITLNRIRWAASELDFRMPMVGGPAAEAWAQLLELLGRPELIDMATERIEGIRAERKARRQETANA